MKLFERHGGYWLFWCSLIYMVTAFSAIMWWPSVQVVIIQIVWLLAISLPLYFPPLGRWLNLDIEWDRKFMKWFNKKEDVLKYLPEGLGVKNKTEEKKSEQHKDTTMYSIGITDTNRVSLRMGYAEVTMNPQGVQNLIDQLELFKQQIMAEPTNDK